MQGGEHTTQRERNQRETSVVLVSLLQESEGRSLQRQGNNNISTSASLAILEQVSQLLVDGQENMLATVQNMIDKSLGKQPLSNVSSAPVSSIASTFQNHAMPPESSATPAPQYGMPMNFYDGQKPPEQYNANGAVRPVAQTGQTGVGGPVLVLWWRISRLLNQLLVYLPFRLILAEQMDLPVIVFLHTLL